MRDATELTEEEKTELVAEHIAASRQKKAKLNFLRSKEFKERVKLEQQLELKRNKQQKLSHWMAEQENSIVQNLQSSLRGLTLFIPDHLTGARPFLRAIVFNSLDVSDKDLHRWESYRSESEFYSSDVLFPYPATEGENPDASYKINLKLNYWLMHPTKICRNEFSCNFGFTSKAIFQ